MNTNWSFGYHTSGHISWLAERMSASQEGLRWMELICCLPISVSRLSRRPGSSRNFLVPASLFPKSTACVNMATKLRLNRNTFQAKGESRAHICTKKFIYLSCLYVLLLEPLAFRYGLKREQVSQKAYFCSPHFHITNAFTWGTR
jgi:hypothetical protein